MNTGTVSVRYAKALYQYAVELGQDQQVYAEMQILAERLRSVHAIHERLADPTVSTEEKCSLLETATTDGKSQLSASLKAFYRLVVESGRGDCLPIMSVSYQNLYRISHGIVPVRLITAAPVGDERRRQLEQLVENVEHGKVEWTHSVDPSLEGGFVLQVDGYRMDASVAARIQRIRKELIEKNNRII